MQTYKAPLRDMRFVLHELHDSATLGRATVLSAEPNIDPGPRLGRNRIGNGARIA